MTFEDGDMVHVELDGKIILTDFDGTFEVEFDGEEEGEVSAYFHPKRFTLIERPAKQPEPYKLKVVADKLRKIADELTM